MLCQDHFSHFITGHKNLYLGYIFWRQILPIVSVSLIRWPIWDVLVGPCYQVPPARMLSWRAPGQITNAFEGR